MALFSIRSREIKPWRVAVLFICVSSLMVCGLLVYAGLNRPRSWQLRSGMTMQEVRAIMGEPTATYPTQKGEEWAYREPENIDLGFREDRLCSAYAGKGSGDHPVNRSEMDAANTQPIR
jgi:hypothetical protein